MFSPADRVVEMRLFSFNARSSRIVRMRRSSSTPISTGTSAKRSNCFSGTTTGSGIDTALPVLAADEVNRVLAQLVHRSHDPGVRLVVPLQHNHVRELGGDIDIGAFQGATHDRPATTCIGY